MKKFLMLACVVATLTANAQDVDKAKVQTQAAAAAAAQSDLKKVDTGEKDWKFSGIAGLNAAATGLVAGIPVVAGASDAMASMYATGMSKLGDAGESSGTTSLVFVSADGASAPTVPVVTRPFLQCHSYMMDQSVLLALL